MSIDAHVRSTPTQVASMNAGRVMLIGGLVASLLVPTLAFLPDLVFLVPFVLILWSPAILAILLITVWDRPWAYLAAAIVGSLYSAMVFLIFGVMEGNMMFNPQTKDFIASWGIMGATAVWWAGALRGRKIVQGRERNTIGTGTGAVALVAISVFVATIGASVMAMSNVEDVGGSYDFVPAAMVEVVITGAGFPDGITVKQGVITELAVQNQDGTLHTFTYQNNGVEYNHEIQPGQTATFLVLFDAAGEVPVRCLPHSESYTQGMVMVLTVEASD